MLSTDLTHLLPDSTTSERQYHSFETGYGNEVALLSRKTMFFNSMHTLLLTLDNKSDHLTCNRSSSHGDLATIKSRNYHADIDEDDA